MWLSVCKQDVQESLPGKGDKDNYSDDKCYKWRWGTIGLYANTSVKVINGSFLWFLLF